MLHEAKIIKFQELYKKHFGMDISRKEALEKGTVLLRLVQLTYKPITKTEYQRLQEHYRETDNLKT